jgi:phage shock protein C
MPFVLKYFEYLVLHSTFVQQIRRKILFFTNKNPNKIFKAMNNKQLRRFQHDSVIGGVAAGLADYLGMDKAWVRFIFVLLLIFGKGFPMLLVYIVLWVALPKADHSTNDLASNWTYPDANTSNFDASKTAQWLGYGLLGIGVYLLFDDFFYWIDIDRFLPAAILIGLGGYLIWRDTTQKNAQLPVEPPTVYDAPAELPTVFDAPAEPTKSEPSIFDEPESPTK